MYSTWEACRGQCIGTMLPRPLAWIDLRSGCPAVPTVTHSRWVHRSELNWDRPDEFDPERFLQPAHTKAEANWFPFSAGRRSCVGSKFAMLEGTILLSMMVRGLVFRRAAGAPPMRPVSVGFVSCAEQGIHLQVTTRTR